jgi:hypothetical protein
MWWFAMDLGLDHELEVSFLAGFATEFLHCSGIRRVSLEPFAVLCRKSNGGRKAD